MVREIEAKVLLSGVKQPDDWFGLKYNMNLYRGCQHQCIYCDSRSECYQIENFADILFKGNALEVLGRELASKRVKGCIGTGSMNDPYMPLESRLDLTGRALKLIAGFGFPVHIITKSGLVLKDLETLRDIARVYAAVSFSFSTCDDDLARRLEPGASLPSERFAAMKRLAARGIYSGVVLMPVLPFLTDSADNIRGILRLAADAGAGYIIPTFGLTLRKGSREYYYGKLDEHFPGLRQRYEQRFGQQYECRVEGAARLMEVFSEESDKLGLPGAIRHHGADEATQTSLFQ